jgi:hypothetical protein
MRILFSSSSLRSGKAHPPEHICGYVPVDATQQTGQRTSRIVYLFFAEFLTSLEQHTKNAEGFKYLLFFGKVWFTAEPPGNAFETNLKLG